MAKHRGAKRSRSGAPTRPVGKPIGDRHEEEEYLRDLRTLDGELLATRRGVKDSGAKISRSSYPSARSRMATAHLSCQHATSRPPSEAWPPLRLPASRLDSNVDGGVDPTSSGLIEQVIAVEQRPESTPHLD